MLGEISSVAWDQFSALEETKNGQIILQTVHQSNWANV
jgi:hypothetical protein